MEMGESEKLREAVEEIKKEIERRKKVKEEELQSESEKLKKLREARMGFWMREAEIDGEKIEMGMQILDYINKLRQDPSFIDLMLIVESECRDKMIPLHSRELRNVFERFDEYLTLDREVHEYFVLDSKGNLIYFQVFIPKYFPEGIWASKIRSDPLKHGGFIIKDPEDFTRLSYESVKNLYETISSGKIIENIINWVKNCVKNKL